MPAGNKLRISHSTWDVIHASLYTIHDTGPAGITRYAALVDAIFDTFPCCVCRRHISERREAWMRGLTEAVGRQQSMPLVIDEIALWAFRLHNEVTMHVRGAGNRFTEMEARGDRIEILRALDKMFNIVYDCTHLYERAG